MPRFFRVLALVLLAALARMTAQSRPSDLEISGVRDPAWSPDGRRLAVSLLDRLWTMTPDGRQPHLVIAPAEWSTVVVRDPSWSPDGKWIAFSANRGQDFDLYVVPSSGGTPVRATTDRGDERWPSWTPDGRLVYAARAIAVGASPVGDQWDLSLIAPSRALRPFENLRVVPSPGEGRQTQGGVSVSNPDRTPGDGRWDRPVRLTETAADNEFHPRVSPDGTRVVFVSDREAEDRETELWMMRLPADPSTLREPQDRPEPGRGTTGSGRGELAEPRDAAPAEQAAAEKQAGSRSPRRRSVRVTQTRGLESNPCWSPDGMRIAYYAVRQGVGSTWVSSAEVDLDDSRDGESGRESRVRPETGPILVSRHGGSPAWSPDGRTIVIAELPAPDPVYNGSPRRDRGDAPPVFGLGAAFRLWSVAAPTPVDDAGRRIAYETKATAGALVGAFDAVWQTLKDLYYHRGDSATAWDELREKYRSKAEAARSEPALESVVDEMIAEQPPIKPPVTSPGAVVVSGHPLASEAGRRALEKGGNIVDAAIAVSFALGVVEPDASGIGGDGMAVLFLQGMDQPTVVEYKDQTPIHATIDNPKIYREGRLVADGPAAANIPGVVAGLDHLYRRHGSGKVPWADLIAPAIEHAENGFVLNEALPTTIVEGQRYFEKYPAARRIFLPGGGVPRPGDRFVNKDYAATLRAIASEGADAFYRGSVAKKIAADLAANGGIIGTDDLAQYRAIERRPLEGRYRSHVVYSTPPPVSSGASLIESLQILDRYKPAPRASFATDPDYFHYLIESWKARDQLRRIADPAHWEVDLANHLTPGHAAELFKKIDPAKASAIGQDDENAGGAGRIGRGTTAFAVADAKGNMIAVTQTLSTWGGTFYVSEGLGFLYNNHLRGNRTTPASYGQLLPLMRSSSTSVPTLVFREAEGKRLPRLAVACAGNAWIPASVYSIIVNVIDSGMPMQRAIEAPRFLVGRDAADAAGRTARVQIEDRIPASTLGALMARGHLFQKIGRKGEVRYGYAAGVLVDVDAGRVEGGAEPRRSHAAVAWDRLPATTGPDR